MTIGESIKELLESGNQVILPGFGNLKKQASGRASAPSGSHIEPPGAHIRFDSSFSKDDGGLAMFWARKSGADPEEARQRVLELVDAIRFALDKGESYFLPGAGEFRRDDDGKVHFSPEKGWLLAPDQYGLESMDLLELEEEPAPDKKPTERKAAEAKISAEDKDKEEKVDADKPKPAPPPPKPPPKPSPPPPPPKKPVERKAPPKPAAAPAKPWERDKKENNHRKTRFWRIIWAVAALLIVVLAVLIFVPTEKLPLLGGKEEAPELPVSQEPAPGDEVPSDDPQDNPTQEALTPSEEEQRPEPEAVTPEEPEVLPDPPQADRYFLIAGSFQNLINASELQDKLLAKGYGAEVISTENRMYRVSIASFQDKRQAEKELHRIKKEPGMESVWLLVNE